MKAHLVIGSKGEVGSAIKKILGKKNLVFGVDKDGEVPKKFDYLHVCFPYSDSFEQELWKYVRECMRVDGLVIIHSTVPVGTTRKFDGVHSPIRGVHPNLEKGIKTFVKYFGGQRADEAASIFKNLGVKTSTVPNPDATEALKLWDTAIYGYNILLEKHIHEWCKDNGLPFDLIYTEANKSYNDGYEKLGKPHYKKYILEHSDGKIGGHCIIPNARLLNSKIAKSIVWINNLL